MVSDPANPDPVDPLAGFSILSLFPRTFNFSTAEHKFADGDIDSVHAYLKDMELRSPNKLLEQAKTILDGNSGLLDTDDASIMIFVDKNEPAAAGGKGEPHERRPALGRKRAQFVLKPNSRQPIVSLKPRVDVDQLQDPEEYFLAIEKLENAEKEMRIQRGIAMKELDQNILSMARPRRPGLLGKSASYKHRYSTASCNDDEPYLSSQKTVMQEAVSFGDSMQPETANPNISSQGRGISGLTATVEDEVKMLFDELLSGDYEDINGDEALNLLKECLHIKPINLDKLCLPDLHDIRQCQSDPLASISLMKNPTSKSFLTKDPLPITKVYSSPPRNSSSDEPINKQSDQVDTGNELTDSWRSKCLLYENGNVTVTPDYSHHLEAGISDPLVDPVEYNCRGLDASSLVELGSKMADNSTDNNACGLCNEAFGNTSKPNKLENQMPEAMQFVQIEHGVQGSVMEKSDNDIEESVAASFDHEMDDTPSSAQDGFHEQSTEMPEAVQFVQLEREVQSFVMKKSENHIEEIIVAPFDHEVNDEPLSAHDGCHEQSIEMPDAVQFVQLKHEVQGSAMEKSDDHIGEDFAASFDHEVNDEPLIAPDGCHVQSIETNPEASKIKSAEIREVELCTHGNDLKLAVDERREPKATLHNPHKRKEHSPGQQIAEKSIAAAINQEVDKPSSTLDGCPEQLIEKSTEISKSQLSGNREVDVPSHGHTSKMAVDERGETKLGQPAPCKRRECSHRQSLAVAGTNWESGVRRSTRIKVKPLEYWKGERLLYGRIHKSLVTVIGLKYASPSRSGSKRSLKVKSYVSDEYKELVEVAALH
ncbi:hypothetical protein Nepgr_005498 [Nepenthes gracilis]|uniref:Centromere protein C n=1 Tax=Nepenthes gracilis TaxID=150966 RepID=A0AAD3XGE0_NEPGR|nr:hypothetical protein Nepgr_005498 [Nepenthes gracilis]